MVSVKHALLQNRRMLRLSTSLMNTSGLKHYTGQSVLLKGRTGNIATGKTNPFIITNEQPWKKSAEISSQHKTRN